MARTTSGRIHDGTGNGRVGEVGDDGTAAKTHGIRRGFGFHHSGATGDGARVLHLLLGDLALLEQIEELADGNFGLLTGVLDHGGQLAESARNVWFYNQDSIKKMLQNGK